MVRKTTKLGDVPEGVDPDEWKEALLEFEQDITDMSVLESLRKIEKPFSDDTACSVLRNQLDYSQGRMRGDYPEVEYRNAVDSLCGDGELSMWSRLEKCTHNYDDLMGHIYREPRWGN